MSSIATSAPYPDISQWRLSDESRPTPLNHLFLTFSLATFGNKTSSTTDF